MSLLEKIQQICEEHEISVSKLEQVLGFGKGSVYKWSRSSPTVEKLEKVANYFKVSLDYLLDRGDIFDLGSYIKAEREYRRISVEEMCEDLGISDFELTQYEEDTTPLTQELLDKILEIFDISYEKFLHEHCLFDEYIPSYFDDVDAYVAFKKAEEEDALNDPQLNIQTESADTNRDEWTEEELKLIEHFKEFVKSLRK